MDKIMDLVRQEALQEMYQSLDRMNQALVSGTEDIYHLEREAQRNLRQYFEPGLEPE